MITGPQSAAARALLGWTLADLSRESGLATATLTDFENAKRPSSSETIQKITSALERNGIEFTKTGVQLISPIYRIEGKDWYVDLLQDVLESGEKDVIIENVDPGKSPQAVIDKLSSLRSLGVNFRMTAEEGNTYLTLPVACYRWVPKEHFINWVTVIYGDCVAVKTSGANVGCTVIKDKELARTMRNKFNFVWDLLKPLAIESTAHVRIE